MYATVLSMLVEAALPFAAASMAAPAGMLANPGSGCGNPADGDVIRGPYRRRDLGHDGGGGVSGAAQAHVRAGKAADRFGEDHREVDRVPLVGSAWPATWLIVTAGLDQNRRRG